MLTTLFTLNLGAIMPIRKLLLSSLSAALLASCASVPSQGPLTAESLLSQPYSLTNATALDADAFLGQLPGWLETSFDTAQFDASIGATVINNLIIAPAGAPKYRLRVARATIWGGDTDQFAAVMSGAASSGLGQVFDRISMEGITSEGLTWDGGAQTIALNIEKIVMDGFSAKSINFAPKADAPEFAGIIRTYAAAANAYAMEGYAQKNFTLTMRDASGAEIISSVAESFARGYNQGRTDYTSNKGIAITTKAPAGENIFEVAQRLADNNASDSPEDKILQPWKREEVQLALKNPISFIATYAGGSDTTRYEIDFTESRNSDVNGLMSWIARWELPPVTETELLDLGTSTILGNRQYWNGKPVISIDRTELKSSDFYWLIPAKFEQVDTGLNYSLVNLIDQSAQLGGTSSADESNELARVRQILVDNGLDNLSGNSISRWRWDGLTGALDTGFKIDFTELADMSFGLDMGGPSLVEWDRLVRTQAGEELAQKVLFTGLNFSLTDETLLDKIYAITATQMGGGTANDIRQSAPAMLRLSGGQVASLNPRFGGYIDALASFLGEGGTLTINASPENGVAADLLAQTGQQNPQTLPDLLNLTVTHQASPSN